MKKELRSELGNVEHSALGFDSKSERYDYDVNSFDPYSIKDSHSALFRNIEPNSLVLDVGCSTGKFGLLLKELKKCVVDGVEYDSNTASMAEETKAYRKVYNCSALDMDSILKEKYDYIVFGDVLEHLYSPWDALVIASKKLKKDGKILISLPNMRYIDIIKGLISDEFNYYYYGLLDTTHIRFFTAHSFADMIKNIADKYKVYFNLELVDTTKSDIAYLYEYKVFELFDIDNELKNFISLQNIYSLTLAKDKKSMSIKGIKNVDYFEKMEKKYLELKEKATKSDLYDNLLKDNEELRKSYAELENKYNNIVNSKRWKITNKICDTIKRK